MRKRASRLRRVALLTSAPAAERRAEGSGVSIFDEPMIDCHTHVLDPVRFAYASDVAYRPSGQEIGTRQQHGDVMDAYGVKHALLVGFGDRAPA